MTETGISGVGIVGLFVTAKETNLGILIRGLVMTIRITTALHRQIRRAPARIKFVVLVVI